MNPPVFPLLPFQNERTKKLERRLGEAMGNDHFARGNKGIVQAKRLKRRVNTRLHCRHFPGNESAESARRQSLLPFQNERTKKLERRLGEAMGNDHFARGNKATV
jgi:hypothetical protein